MASEACWRAAQYSEDPVAEYALLIKVNPPCSPEEQAGRETRRSGPLRRTGGWR